MIDTLRDTYSLKELLRTVHLSKSSYFYQEHKLNAPDKYKNAREQIRKVFSESYESYRYRRIYKTVKKEDGSNYSEKVIRRLMIDCFDGLPVSWTIGVSPNADLVNTMLDEAIITLKENERPIVHSDRGCHYRWPG